MSTNQLRWEAWPMPGVVPYTVKVRDLQAVGGSGNRPKKPIGGGSVEIPRNALRADGTKVLDQVLFADPDAPANDVASVIRVYRPGVDTPIHEWLTEDPLPENDNSDTVRLGGRNIEALLDYEFVEVWDWDGSTEFVTQFPDHVYGGKNLATGGSFENQGLINEVYLVENDGTGGDTFTFTVMGQTTAAIAWNASATAVETALENLSNVTNVLVTGAGTTADPWRIEFVTPAIVDPDMTETSAGFTVTIVKETEGELSISPWTISQTIAQGINWNHGLHSSESPQIDDTVARTGTYNLYFNGLNQYAGVQRVFNVKPGGLYQFSLWARTGNTSDLFRLVIRTPTEEFVASSTPFGGSTLPASTWTQFTAADVTIPDGVTQVVMRFAYVGTGNPDPIRTDDWEVREGMSADTAGQILIDLFDDAQTDHAPTRAALTYINLDFTAALDSAGVAWDRSDVSMTIKRRQSYLQMMRQFEKLGYEWRLVPSSTAGEWDLQVYNPGGMGTDHGGADDPAIVVGQGTLPSNVTRQPPAANYLMAEGKAGLTTRTSDTNSIGAIGRRAQGVYDRRFTETSDLTAWVGQRLADFLAETLAPRVTIQEPNQAEIWPRPLDEYEPGDILDFILADGATRVERRIENLAYVDDGAQALRWTIEAGSAQPFVAAAGGGSGGGGGGSVTTGSRPFGQTGDQGLVAGPIGAQTASQLQVLGNAVATILEEYRFDEDEPDDAVGFGAGAGLLPAFTVRVAASDARPESQAVADFICDANDAWPQFKAADDICSALGFGRVLLSEGEFWFETNFTSSFGVSFEGLGSDVTELWSDASFNIQYNWQGPFGKLLIAEEDACG